MAVHQAAGYVLGDSHLELKCDPNHHMGGRPCHHVNTVIGGPCEMWVNRNTLTVLHSMLQPWMNVIEWSSGSSTTYLLRHVNKLYDVEHCKPWIDNVAKVVNDTLPWKAADYYPNGVPCSANDKCECGDKTDRVEYTKFARNKISHMNGKWDLAVVDGPDPTRVGCFREGMELINQKYGMILLDNSERVRYTPVFKELPAHWLIASFGAQSVYEKFSEKLFLNGGGGATVETSVVMACPQEDDYCARARQEIHRDMHRLKSYGVVGRRYYDHVRAC